MDEPTEPSEIEVARFRSMAAADEHALVLMAVGIESRVGAEAGAFSLRVAAADAGRARRELASYVRENRRPPALIDDGRPLGAGIDAALAVWAALVFLFSASRQVAFGVDWLSAGAAVAWRVADGEWWRVLTALGLHADAGHLMSNLVAGGGLALLLTQPLGAGIAWLAILLGGGLGNLLNILLRSPDHATVGASTAVFAALGLLAALACARRMSLAVRGHRRWAPLGAGVMLLAFMGVGGERTDIGAHFAGFFCGAALGGLVALAGPHLPQSHRAQRLAGGMAAALFALAWLAALAAPP